MWLLDTNICIYLIKKRPPSVLDRLRTLNIREVAISSITLAELEFGVAKSAKPEVNAQALAAFVAPLGVEPFEDVAAAAYGDVRAQLERARTPIGSLDMLIAGHALSLDATLVTNNEREFRKVAHLKVQSWV